MLYAIPVLMQINIEPFKAQQAKDISFLASGKRVYLAVEGRDHNGDMWCSDAHGSRFVLNTLLAARDAGDLNVMGA